MVPRKTHIARAPHHLADDRHFWRGCIDGDGSIMMTHGERRYPMLDFCSASRPFVEQFIDFCAGIIPRERMKIKNQCIWSVVLPGSMAVEVIRVLYSDAKVSLDRKQARAEEAMRYRFRVKSCAVQPAAQTPPRRASESVQAPAVAGS